MSHESRRTWCVVAGIDFSQSSISALRWMQKWLLGDGKLILANALVVPEIQGLLAERYPLPESLLVNARAGARKRLEELRGSFGIPDASIEIREGSPGDALVQIARECAADLIVVGKHGDGGAVRGYTGRTADRLVRAAPAPVLVANDVMGDRPTRVIVPLTYSSVTPFITQWAQRIHQASGADIVATHVVGAAVLSHVLSMSTIRTGETPTSGQIDEIFSDDRDVWKNELVAAGIPAARITTEVVFGEVSSAVLMSASRHEADMIVMGSHAGPVRRLLLGSAASAVLRNADIPVLVVVEPEEQETAEVDSNHASDFSPASKFSDYVL